MRLSSLRLSITLSTLLVVSCSGDEASEEEQAHEHAHEHEHTHEGEHAHEHQHAENSAEGATEVPERFTQLVARLQAATIVGVPSTQPCTLSGGAETECLKITTVAAPSDHITGPFCPRTIQDTPAEGGTWFVDGEVRDVDGPFVANLAEIYGDEVWQMFDAQTGEVHRVAGAEGCAAAGSPNEPLTNVCVECELAYIGRTLTQTYFIPLEPAATTTPGERIGPHSGIGLAWNGVKLDAPAPLDMILGGHTLGPFDDCAGHINPHSGYHYHGIRPECGARVDAAEADHAALLGVAMDGYDIYDRLNADGQEPEDLDECRGHTSDELGYHYHVNPTAENQIIDCFSGQTGCSSTDSDAACDATQQAGRRPGGRPGGGRPGGPPGGEGGGPPGGGPPSMDPE